MTNDPTSTAIVRPCGASLLRRQNGTEVVWECDNRRGHDGPHTARSSVMGDQTWENTVGRFRPENGSAPTTGGSP